MGVITIKVSHVTTSRRHGHKVMEVFKRIEERFSRLHSNFGDFKAEVRHGIGVKGEPILRIFIRRSSTGGKPLATRKFC